MIKSVTSIFIATVMWMGIGLTAPAAATSCFAGFCMAGILAHGNDTGYAAPILIRCAANGIHWVEESTNSQSDCDGEYSDMDAVIVRANEEIWCEKLNAPWWMHKDKKFDATGTHEVGDSFAFRCVVQRD